MTPYQTQASVRLQGCIRVAADKSISHRSLIFAALAEGDSKIRHLLLGEDVLRTLTILNQLGVKTSHSAETLKPSDELIVHGVGLRGLKPTHEVLYCGNSGTTMRLMLGLLAGQPFESVLTGDDSLNKRPMERVFAPLKQMGAVFEVRELNGKRLIVVNPGGCCQNALKNISYVSPVASAQVKSAILLAGLYADGETSVTESSLSRNHSEIMLKGLGAPVRVEGFKVFLNKIKKAFAPIDIDVPGDISSAAFFIVAGLIVPGSEIIIENVNLNPTRTGILDVLLQMGSDIKILQQYKMGGEEVGNLRVRSSILKNIAIEGAVIPRLIDEIPILALAGFFSDGMMVVSDAKELRVKETDRIQAICVELRKLGAVIYEHDDGFELVGSSTQILSTQEGLLFNSYGDHRMAMMEVIAGLLLPNPATIDDVACVKTSFPDFFELLRVLRG